MKSSQKGFTFVELIVVLVIIAILATVGFVSYESYLAGGRDTAKISLLRDINTSFSTYGLQSRIPLPGDYIEITANGSIFAYQGDFTDSIANTIGFKGNPYDDTLDIYPTYMVSLNQKDTQILHYLEDPATLQTGIYNNTYANIDYLNLHPKVIGRALGVMMDDETQEPLHFIDSVSNAGSYDVITGTLEVRAYYSDNVILNDDMSKIIPNKSCQRILELGGSRGNGIYTISPSGSGSIRTYCDMTTDGGGWTFVAYSDTRNDSQDLFSSYVGDFRSDRTDGDIDDENTSYSIDASIFKHTEMMIALDEKEILSANRENKLVFFRYSQENEYFYSGPLPCAGSSLDPFVRIGLSGDFQQNDFSACSGTLWRPRFSGENLITFRSTLGSNWHSVMGGDADNTTRHSARIYVR